MTTAGQHYLAGRHSVIRWQWLIGSLWTADPKLVHPIP